MDFSICLRDGNVSSITRVYMLLIDYIFFQDYIRNVDDEILHLQVLLLKMIDWMIDVVDERMDARVDRNFRNFLPYAERKYLLEEI